MIEVKGVEKMNKEEVVTKFNQGILSQLSILYSQANQLLEKLEDKMSQVGEIVDIENEFDVFMHRLDFVGDVTFFMLDRALISFSKRPEVTVERLIENGKNLLKILEPMFSDINRDFGRISSEVDLIGKPVSRGDKEK